MKRSVIVFSILLLLGAGISGCGQSGDLYLPNDQSAQSFSDTK